MEEHNLVYYTLYHLTFETKMKIFAFMFCVVIIPSVVVFLVCFLKDRKKRRILKQNSSSPPCIKAGRRRDDEGIVTDDKRQERTTSERNINLNNEATPRVVANSDQLFSNPEKIFHTAEN
ncbi:uncharacterized protein LOC143462341 [Clavelina lepadiformis]|uniref:Uncharacterized protein n=1 Tax=Clavelina lepadiformis TaxID=159417 RepID=A0ABP0FYY1_CLALP